MSIFIDTDCGLLSEPDKVNKNIEDKHSQKINKSAQKMYELLQHVAKRLEKFEEGDVVVCHQEKHPVLLYKHIQKFLADIDKEE